MHNEPSRIQQKRREIEIKGENGCHAKESYKGKKKTGIKKKIKIGMIFSKLTALENLGDGRWLFSCECGNQKDIRASHVTFGASRSCGCTKRHEPQNNYSNTLEFSSWSHMKTRCLNKNCSQYSYYGGRGISICDRWIHSFKNFLADMGPRQSTKHSLDRIDTNQNYYPENCKWSTHKEQVNNQRRNKILDHNGKKQTLSMWCSELNLPYHTVKARINRQGWSIERSLNEPIRSIFRK